MKVLLVEDDVPLAETIRTNLTSENHVVEIAQNGADGSFLARSFDYDAIVLDNSLPKKDGLTVCKEVRSSGKTTPIIFLTIDDTMETKLSAFDVGAVDIERLTSNRSKLVAHKFGKEYGVSKAELDCFLKSTKIK